MKEITTLQFSSIKTYRSNFTIFADCDGETISSDFDLTIKQNRREWEETIFAALPGLDQDGIDAALRAADRADAITPAYYITIANTEKYLGESAAEVNLFENAKLFDTIEEANAEIARIEASTECVEGWAIINKL